MNNIYTTQRLISHAGSRKADAAVWDRALTEIPVFRLRAAQMLHKCIQKQHKHLQQKAVTINQTITWHIHLHVNTLRVYKEILLVSLLI